MKAFDDRICYDDTTGLERVRYFPRQLLTADDMRAEQEYLRQRQRRFNRFVVGWGVVCGLEVVYDLKQPHQVTVCPGYALGPWGDEIYVPEAVAVEFAGRFDDPADPCEPVRRSRKVAASFPTSDRNLYVAIRYAECLLRPVRTSAPGCGCDETVCEYSRVRDSFDIDFLRTLPTSHRRPDPPPPSLCLMLEEEQLPACPPCPKEPWLVLATLRFGRGADDRSPAAEESAAGVKVDNFKHRRPLVSVSRLQDQLIQCCCTDEHEEEGPREPITVDFETPSLAGELRRFINPYTASGVKFTAESAGFGDEAVGLVTNNAGATSVCLPPESTRQFLAAGRTTMPEYLGMTWLKIKATLPDGGRPAPVTVTADIQTGGGATVRVQLFDASGALLGTGTETATSEGKCPNAQGGDRGRATVTAHAATGRVAYAIVDEVSGGIIFIIDAFKVT